MKGHTEEQLKRNRPRTNSLILMFMVVTFFYSVKSQAKPPNGFVSGNNQLFFEKRFAGEFGRFGTITPIAEKDFLIAHTDTNIDDPNYFYFFPNAMETSFENVQKKINHPDVGDGSYKVNSIRGRDDIFVAGYSLYLASYSLKNGQLDVSEYFDYEANDAMYDVFPIENKDKYVAFGDDRPFVFNLNNKVKDFINFDTELFGTLAEVYDSAVDLRPETTNIIASFYAEQMYGELDYTKLTSNGLTQTGRTIEFDDKAEDKGCSIGQAHINKDLVCVGIITKKKREPFVEINIASLTKKRRFGAIGTEPEYFVFFSFPETNKFITFINEGWILIDLDIPGDDLMIDVTEFLTETTGDVVKSLYGFDSLSIIVVGDNESTNEGFVRHIGFCHPSCTTCQSSKKSACLGCQENKKLTKVSGKSYGTCSKSFMIASISFLFFFGIF